MPQSLYFIRLWGILVSCRYPSIINIRRRRPQKQVFLGGLEDSFGRSVPLRGKGNIRSISVAFLATISTLLALPSLIPFVY